MVARSACTAVRRYGNRKFDGHETCLAAGIENGLEFAAFFVGIGD
jgi:hypothetical protein